VTLEDETGVINLVVRPEVWSQYRLAARAAVALLARGMLEKHGQVIHLVAESLEDLTSALAGTHLRSRDFR